MDLTGAVASSEFAGFQDFLAGDVITLPPDASETYLEPFTLNLAAAAGSHHFHRRRLCRDEPDAV